jgi:hypothetical protein
MSAVHLARIDPARNVRRFYRLDVQPDLFGGFAVVKGTTVTVYRIVHASLKPSRKSTEGSAGVARIARVIVPDLPHHVTQRGNRREPVFFEADDYRLYRQLVAAAARGAGTVVWAYCPMLPPAYHAHLARRRRTRTGCGRPLPKRTGATPGPSMLGSGGRAIGSRVALGRW